MEKRYRFWKRGFGLKKKCVGFGKCFMFWGKRVLVFRRDLGFRRKGSNITGPTVASLSGVEPSGKTSFCFCARQDFRAEAKSLNFTRLLGEGLSD